MPDELDLAGKHNEEFQAFALHHQRHNRELNNYTGDTCVDCDEPIPAARKKAQQGCLRCIDCQKKHETRRNM